MAKSKEQKQQEAIDRMRKGYWNELRKMQFAEPGGRDYELVKFKYGIGPAKRSQADARVAFNRFLREAKLDTKGNPVKPVQ
jgi:hypothetical protein